MFTKRCFACIPLILAACSGGAPVADSGKSTETPPLECVRPIFLPTLDAFAYCPSSPVRFSMRVCSPGTKATLKEWSNDTLVASMSAQATGDRTIEFRFLAPSEPGTYSLEVESEAGDVGPGRILMDLKVDGC